MSTVNASRLLALWALALALVGPVCRARGDELVPAGTINGALGRGPFVILAEDHPKVLQYARGVKAQFFRDAKLLVGDEIGEADLSGTSLVVYGSLGGHPWLSDHQDSLPFQFGVQSVVVAGQRFAGEHLRVICAIRNPEDPNHRALIYAASSPEDVFDINRVFHGPTEWVVADGARVLASGSFPSTGPLSVADMRADLDDLLEKLDAVHPATVEGRSEALQKAIDFLETKITEPLAREDFWFLLADVLHSLHDAHSSLGAAPRSSLAIDLPVVWLSDGLLVTRDTAQLRRGDRVRSIGGHDGAAILRALARLIPAETANWVKVRAPSSLVDRAVLRQLGLATGDGPVEVGVERGGESISVTLPVGRGFPPPSPSPLPWIRSEFDEEHSLAVLSLDQCNWNDEYRRALHSFFVEVHEKELTRVAVDLRRNSGGNSAVVREFLRYLAVDEYADYSAAVRESEYSLRSRGGRGPPGFVRYGPQRRRNDPVPDLPAFDGELFLLTSAQTFSSGNWFATVVQDNGLGRIVGEATGNSPSSFGDILTFTLPRSAFTYQLSYKQFIRPDPSRDPAECIVPDVAVPVVADDYLAQVDRAMEFVRSGE